MPFHCSKPSGQGCSSSHSNKPSVLWQRPAASLTASSHSFFPPSPNQPHVFWQFLEHTRRICLRALVVFSRSVVSDSLRPNGLQRTGLPGPSPSSSACSHSCPLRQWCRPTISSSVVPFCLQSFPASGCFQWVGSSHLVAKGLELQFQHQSFQWIFRIDFLQDWLVWSPLIIQGALESSPTQLKSINSSVPCLLYVPFINPCMTTGRTIALTIQTFVSTVMSLLFNILSRLIIACLPRSKRLLTSWLQSLTSVILEPKKIVSHCFHCFPVCLAWRNGTGCHDLSILNVEF